MSSTGHHARKQKAITGMYVCMYVCEEIYQSGC